MNTHIWLVKLLTALISIFQASTLRDRLYTANNRIEILELAIEDIERISASRVDSSERHRLIAGICDRVRDDC
jgi:nicotinic acid mononucleotide adenylyltransferase